MRERPPGRKLGGQLSQSLRCIARMAKLTIEEARPKIFTRNAFTSIGDFDLQYSLLHGVLIVVERLIQGQFDNDGAFLGIFEGIAKYIHDDL